MEETGLSATQDELIFLSTELHKSFDEVTKMTNHPRRNVYLLKRRVSVDDLVIEDGKALGFESWSLDKLFNLDESESKRFIPTLLNESGLRIFELIRKNI